MVLLSSFLLAVFALQDYFTDMNRDDLKNEATYAAKGYALNGENYLETLSPVSKHRLTLISPDGTVLFDSVFDPALMENHLDRAEVSAALQTGTGESTRYSSTLSEKTYYYAVRLDDGSVLRAAETKSSVLSLMMGMLPAFSLILIVSILLSAFLASKLSKNIVKPLNRVDFDNPETLEVYEELSPFVRRIRKQNLRIREQMLQMREKQMEFSEITENLSEGFLVINELTEVLSCNSSALSILGEESFCKGQSVYILNRSPALRKSVETALGGKKDAETLALGGKIYQLIASPVVRDGKTVGAVLVLLDITEREQREKLRREFSANVSHELKTPLTSISGFAEIIKAGIAKPGDVERFAENIYTEAQRMISLIGDILRLSQLDEDEFSAERTPVDLEPMIHSVINRLAPKTAEKRLSVKVEACTAKIMGIESVLDEILYNICENGVKYNLPDGKLDVTLSVKDQNAVITVADTGIGIPEADRERVFERFYRVDKGRSHGTGGTGLGLSIVKHGVALHGGTVSLESREGEGTTVTLSFPLSADT